MDRSFVLSERAIGEVFFQFLTRGTFFKITFTGSISRHSTSSGPIIQRGWIIQLFNNSFYLIIIFLQSVNFCFFKIQKELAIDFFILSNYFIFMYFIYLCFISKRVALKNRFRVIFKNILRWIFIKFLLVTFLYILYF